MNATETAAVSSSNGDATAYDYDAQRWVTGPAAVVLLAAQEAEEASLANDPAYLAFIGKASHV